jgi:hypothetical protein
MLKNRFWVAQRFQRCDEAFPFCEASALEVRVCVWRSRSRRKNSECFGQRPHSLPGQGPLTLLEEKWNAVFVALISDRDHPSLRHRAGAGPLSPPTMAQLMPVRSNSPRPSSNGSIERKRTLARSPLQVADPRQTPPDSIALMVTAVYSHASSAGSCLSWSPAWPAPGSISCASPAVE